MNKSKQETEFKKGITEVASKNSTDSLVARRYAISLIETADTSGILKKLENDAVEIAAMIEDSEELQFFLSNPIFSTEQQNAVLSSITSKAKFQELTGNFLKVLVENKRLPLLEEILSQFQCELSERRGEVSAHAVAAIKMTQKQTKALEDKIAEAIGQKVALDVQVDETLIGGLVVTVGSTMIDASVKRKLERLEKVLKDQSNQNTLNKKEVG